MNKVIDGLLRLGAEVVHSGVADVHATGHAQAEELKMLLAIAEPELFIPVHGEFRHMMAHARSPSRWGCPQRHILLCEDGDVVALTDDGIASPGGCRPATSTSTASSAMSVTACCATVGCSRRRASSSSW